MMPMVTPVVSAAARLLPLRPNISSIGKLHLPCFLPMEMVSTTMRYWFVNSYLDFPRRYLTLGDVASEQGKQRGRSFFARRGIIWQRCWKIIGKCRSVRLARRKILRRRGKGHGVSGAVPLQYLFDFLTPAI